MAFRDKKAEFEARGAVVLGVSKDSLAAQRKFAEKHNLDFPLLSDTSAEVIKAYGAWQLKTQYGREYWGTQRSTVIIDQEGRVRKVYPTVKVDGHADEVLRDLDALRAEYSGAR